MRIIDISIDNEYVKGQGVVIGAAGSYSDVALRIRFNEMWDGLAKHVTWLDANGENPVIIYFGSQDYDGEGYVVPVPAEAKAVAGNAYMSVKGTDNNKGTLTAKARFRVLESVYDENAEESVQPSPSVADQLQLQIDSLSDDVNSMSDDVGSLTENRIYIGTCSTAADISEKVVTVSADQNFALEEGAILLVFFENGNTASTVMLNVNGSGAKLVGFATGGSNASVETISGHTQYLHRFGREIVAFVFGNTTFLETSLGGVWMHTPSGAFTYYLYDQLGLKAPLASPAFTGTPTAPTAAAETDTTQIATTAFVAAAVAAYKTTVDAALNLKAPLASPAFTGAPTVPTPSASDNSSKAVNTAWVKARLSVIENFTSELESRLNNKAPLASPEFTGTPTAPTPTSSSDNTQIATKGYVDEAKEVVVVNYAAASATLWNTLYSAYSAGKTVILKESVSGSSGSTTRYYRLAEFESQGQSTQQVVRRMKFICAQGTTNRNLVLQYTYNQGAETYSWYTNSSTSLAPLASPTFTGTPKAPTPTSSSADTQIATKKYVDDALASAVTDAIESSY